MNQQQFLKRMEEEYTKNVEISRKKNSDYAGLDDPFKNFKACEMFGIDPKQAILVRMTDKMTRISNLLQREAQVLDESIGDTLSDLCNYSMILKLFIENEKTRSTIHTSFQGMAQVETFPFSNARTETDTI